MATITRRTVVAVLCLVPLALLTGCGAGGGGGAASVTGRILLVSTAQPPDPAATVTIAGKSATTQLDGTFTVTGLTPSATSVTITATGAITLTQVLPAITSGAVTDLGDVYLSADGYTSSITGRIASADTLNAIAGAGIHINGLRTTSAADGTFALAGLPVGLGRGSAQIGVVHATGFDDKALVLDLELDAGANPLGDILMSTPVGTIPGGPKTIGGTVTLQNQPSAAGVTVNLVDAGGSQVGSVITAGDGTYAFWVGKGSYTLQFAATGFQFKSTAVTVTRLDQVQTVNVTLTP